MTYVFRRRVLSITLAVWAFLMCWSRIYLCVHYFGDIVFGMIVGFITASLVYYVFQHMLRQSAHSLKPTDDSCKLYIPATICHIETVLLLILSFFTRFSF